MAKKNNFEYWPYLSIVLIVVIVAGVVLFTNGGKSASTTGVTEDLAGEAFKAQKNTQVIKNSLPACKDTDGGINYNIKGQLTGLKTSIQVPDEDYCVGDTLYEVYCNKDGKGIVLSENCEYGCLQGVCLHKPERACVDSDNGDFPEIKGYATGFEFDYMLDEYPDFAKKIDDYCYKYAGSFDALAESVCTNGGYVDAEIHFCSSCKNGVCLTPSCKEGNLKKCNSEPSCLGSGGKWVNNKCTFECIDSDGSNLFTYGTVTGWRNDLNKVNTNSDSCINDLAQGQSSGNYIMEWFCFNNQTETTTVKCPVGTICKEGACTQI